MFQLPKVDRPIVKRKGPAAEANDSSCYSAVLLGVVVEVMLHFSHNDSASLAIAQS